MTRWQCSAKTFSKCLSYRVRALHQQSYAFAFRPRTSIGLMHNRPSGDKSPGRPFQSVFSLEVLIPMSPVLNEQKVYFWTNLQFPFLAETTQYQYKWQPTVLTYLNLISYLHEAVCLCDYSIVSPSPITPSQWQSSHAIITILRSHKLKALTSLACNCEHMLTFGVLSRLSRRCSRRGSASRVNALWGYLHIPPSPFYSLSNVLYLKIYIWPVMCVYIWFVTYDAPLY